MLKPNVRVGFKFKVDSLNHKKAEIIKYYKKTKAKISKSIIKSRR